MIPVCTFLLLSIQAPQLPWPALKGAGPTVLACMQRTSAKPVWGDFTARQLASLNRAESAAQGTWHSENEDWFKWQAGVVMNAFIRSRYAGNTS